MCTRRDGITVLLLRAFVRCCIRGPRFGGLSQWHCILESERRLMVLPNKSDVDSDVPS